MSKSKLQRWGALPLLLLFFALLVNGIPRLSLTYDEPSHLAAGYGYLARGREGMWTIPQRGHPLLANAWAALPLYLGNPNLEVETLDGWGHDRRAYARAFIHAIGPLPVSEFAGRYPMALLTMMLAAVVFRWATDVSGITGGLVALMVLTFDPTLLAHGRLATNDIGVLALGTLALFITARWTRHHTWLQACTIGGVLGITILAKSSGVLWAGAVGITGLVNVLHTKERLRPALQLTAMSLIALLIVWGMYGFTLGPLTAIPRIIVPAPLHWESVVFQTAGVDTRPLYVLGMLGQGQRWWYFPLAFAIKNPLPLIIAALTALFITPMSQWRRLHPLPLFTTLYLGIAIAQGPNIGYRHLTPLHPTLYLLVAGTVPTLWQKRRSSYKIILITLGIVYLATTIWITPFELSFFNVLVGGPQHGWYYLSDSNTDWMQALKALRAWQEKTGIRFHYAGPEGYTGLADYNLDYDPLPSTFYNPEPLFQPAYAPPPGEYVISPHALNGLGFIDTDNYAWFRYQKPDAFIGQTLLYYHVPQPSSATWLAQCTQPAIPLDEETIKVGFGEIPPRAVTFDCTQSWVYPTGGSQPGWYVLHDKLLSSPSWTTRLQYNRPPCAQDTFIQTHLSGLQLNYRQQNYHTLPAFAMYTQPISSIPHPHLSTHYSAPAGTPPRTLMAQEPLSTPSSLEGNLAFLGTSLYSNNGSLDVETWWQVERVPLTRTLSVMGHLISPEGETVSVADGLGFTPEAWRPGDIIVQRHHFDLPLKGTWLRTGVYNFETGVRWSGEHANADAIFIPLQALGE